VSGRGSAVADIDNDGDLDLFVVDLAGPSRLFENVSGSRRSWIRVEPVAGERGPTALGTRVAVTADGRTQIKTFLVSPSYASGSLTDMHFGLDLAQHAQVEVFWPDGAKRTFPDVKARGVYRADRSGGLERKAVSGPRIPIAGPIGRAHNDFDSLRLNRLSSEEENSLLSFAPAFRGSLGPDARRAGPGRELVGRGGLRSPAAGG
jgi:hypothetical protein